MKKIYCILALLFCLVSCDDKLDQKAVTPIDGTWYTSMTVGNEDVVEVYIEFDRGDFIIFQRSGTQRRFFTYKGTFTYTDGILTGEYDDSTPWGAEYAVTLEEGAMLMENLVSGEVNYYDATDVPEDIWRDAVPAIRTKADYIEPVF